MANRPVKVIVSDVQHYTGARHTRTTWTARVPMTDGPDVECGHTGHLTTAAASKCGVALYSRLVAEVDR